MPLVAHRSTCIGPLDEGIVTTPEVPTARDRGLRREAPMLTHPDCAGCCGRGVCHWCLQPARPSIFGGELLRLRWQDGFAYAACPDHHAYLRSAIAGDVAPNAIGAGLA